MRTLMGCLLALAAGLIASVASAEDAATPAASSTEQNRPSWAPGAAVTPATLNVPGRYVSNGVGVSLVLPESWRAEDVSARELSPEEAQAIHPDVKAALVVELSERGKKQPLLTVYRADLAGWRLLEKDGKAGPGRVTLTNYDSAFIVLRGPEAKKRDRYATLRLDVEDAISTLAIYDPRKEGQSLRLPLGEQWAGTLPGGDPIRMQLQPNGILQLSWGKDGKEARGQWLQRESQVIAVVVGIDPRPKKSILMHFDGKGLVIVSWDESVFGPAGGRLDAVP